MEGDCWELIPLVSPHPVALWVLRGCGEVEVERLRGGGFRLPLFAEGLVRGSSLHLSLQEI